MYGIGKADNALRVLRCATQFVTLLAAHTAFVTAAPVSFMPLHSFRPSFRYITPRSQPDHLLQGMAHYPTHKAKAQVMHIPFRKPRYNTHWVPFRSTTSYIHFGRIQSTCCPQFGVPCCLLQLRVCHSYCSPTHQPDESNNIRQTFA